MSESKGTNHLTYLLLGVGVGAVVALILAPQSGEETRRYIAGKAEEGKDYVAGKSRQVRKQAEGFAAKSRELLMKGKERVAGAVQAGKQTYYAALQR